MTRPQALTFDHLTDVPFTRPSHIIVTFRRMAVDWFQVDVTAFSRSSEQSRTIVFDYSTSQEAHTRIDKFKLNADEPRKTHCTVPVIVFYGERGYSVLYPGRGKGWLETTPIRSLESIILNPAKATPQGKVFVATKTTRKETGRINRKEYTPEPGELLNLTRKLIPVSRDYTSDFYQAIYMHPVQLAITRLDSMRIISNTFHGRVPCRA